MYQFDTQFANPQLAMPKVFVTNRGGHDYTAAERFGELVYISDGLLRKDQTSQMFRLCQEAMGDSSADDHLLITSLASLCSIAAGYLVAKHGRLNLLVWNDGQYVARSISFNSLKESNDAKRGSRKGSKPVGGEVG